MSIGYFPFGESIKDVVQTDTGPKSVFVLGVYSSAVHARWVGPDGKQRIAALAVANEPSIFWRGDGADEVISTISVPPGAGRLEPARAALNGPSGVALDELFLAPLGFARADAWLCDLVPHSCMNLSQQAAINRAYLPVAAAFGLASATAPPVPRELASPSRVASILAELEASDAETVVLLGDQPIRWFLNSFDRSRRNLRAFGTGATEYGQPRHVRIGSRDRRVIALVHPRQAAGLGTASMEWKSIHDSWFKSRGNGAR